MPSSLVQLAAAARSGARASDSAAATVHERVAARYGLHADARPPIGESARSELERRMGEAMLQGDPVPLSEVGYWLKLVRWAATSADATALEEADDVEAMEAAQAREADARRRPRGA